MNRLFLFGQRKKKKEENYKKLTLLILTLGLRGNKKKNIMSRPISISMEDAQFARDIASGVCIIDIPPAQAPIPGGLESPATSVATSEETKVPQEPIVDAGGSDSSIPDGGLRAWLVVVGGFLDFAIAFGKFCFWPFLLFFCAINALYELTYILQCQKCRSKKKKKRNRKVETNLC